MPPSHKPPKRGTNTLMATDSERLTKLETQVGFVFDTVTRIEAALPLGVSKIDFEEFKRAVLAQLADFDKRTRETEKQIWIWVGAGAVVSFVISLGGSLVVTIIASLILQALSKP